jgi:hypothetical protein
MRNQWPGGVFAVAATGLGMSALDTVLLIMCIMRSWSWLLVMVGPGVVAHSGRRQGFLQQWVSGGIKFVNNVFNHGRCR